MGQVILRADFKNKKTNTKSTKKLWLLQKKYTLCDGEVTILLLHIVVAIGRCV